MLRFRQIALYQFKNYPQTRFSFSERVTGICGLNGAGKTNLLDAIHYLCFTKSYFSRTDNGNVLIGANGFRIEGNFELNNHPETAVCILRETGKKEFSLNGDPYERFSKHVGRYTCVVIAPDDAALITGDSRERRSFLDSILCQVDTTYMQHLISYKKVLGQRNSLLKQFAESGMKNYHLLDVLDRQLEIPGNFIFEKRNAFLFSFLPLATNFYSEIAQKQENINLVYESELLQQPIKDWLIQNRNKDCLAQRTTSGVHRDDIDILMDEKEFRNTASQGQRKSLLFALKLAEMEVLKNEKGFAPLLLLDDVFEKLDENRIGRLLHKVCNENNGQVFITDTNEERLKQHLDVLSVKYDIINL
ncbi:MAG: DNA replication and repair protein RecF [Chitinophagaceae bacterium]|nr:DNA replication and repair protein RecF [Chitinophagaceae bacterium]